MTATTTLSTTTPRSTLRRAASAKQLWKTGAISGVVAAAATTAVAASASALDIPIEVGGESIPLLGFAQLTFVGAIIGTVLAVVFAHRASRPRHAFLVTTIALTLLSIVPDLFADAPTATRLTLALTHVVAAAIVIPALSSRLSN